MATDTVVTNIMSHLDTQLNTITGVNEFIQIDPARLAAGGKTKADWVAFAYQTGIGLNKLASAEDYYQRVWVRLRVGIFLGDSEKDEHETQISLAWNRLYDWYSTWYAQDLLQTAVSNVEALQPANFGRATISNNPMRSIAYFDIDISIVR